MDERLVLLKKYMLGQKAYLDKRQLSFYKEFPSYFDALSFADSPYPHSGKLQPTTEDDDSFYGGKFSEVMNLAWYGDKKLLNGIRSMRDKILALLPSTAMKDDFLYNESGSEVDVAKFLTGQPDCMVECIPREKQAINIGVSVGYSYGTEHKSIMMAGAAIFIILEMLHLNGYQTRLVVESASTNGSNIGALSFPIKEYHQPFDTGRIAFMLAHPGSLRRVIFAIREHLPLDTCKLFGFSYSGSHSRSIFSSVTDTDLHFSVGEIAGSFSTITDAVAFTKNILNKQLCLEK